MVQHRLSASSHHHAASLPFASVANRRVGRTPLYAAIDLGTHNCRLLVARAGERGLRVIDSFSRAVRLGEGLHHSGQLAEAAMERTITALRACVARMGLYELHSHRAIATEACRRAGNGMDFIARVMHETGLNISVISAREEAELALAAAIRCCRTGTAPPGVACCSTLAAARPKSHGHESTVMPGAMTCRVMSACQWAS